MNLLTNVQLVDDNDEDNHAPFTITQDAMLGFPLNTTVEPTATGNHIATAAQTPTTEPKVHRTTRQGALQHIVQGLAGSNTPQQTATQFLWQQTAKNDTT